MAALRTVLAVPSPCATVARRSVSFLTRIDLFALRPPAGVFLGAREPSEDEALAATAAVPASLRSCYS